MVRPGAGRLVVPQDAPRLLAGEVHLRGGVRAARTGHADHAAPAARGGDDEAGMLAAMAEIHAEPLRADNGFDGGLGRLFRLLHDAPRVTEAASGGLDPR